MPPKDSTDKQLWFTMGRDPVLDLHATVQALITDPNQQVHIGTDAQRQGRRTDFVTVVALYTPGKGGRVFFTRRREPKHGSLREKLALETWSSIEVGLALAPLLPAGAEQISIHVDANPNPKFRSSDYVKELTGMVMGQGFRSVLKPNAWASSHAADHVVKNRHLAVRERKRERRRVRRSRR